VRPSSRLDTLADTAARRALALRQVILEQAPTVQTWTSKDQRAIAYAVIEGANLWEGYCRAFYISSAFRAREVSGQRVKIGASKVIRTVNDAVTVAIHRVAPELRGRSGPWNPREEPDWSGQLAVCLAELEASNLPKLERAVGLHPEALNHMRAVRNYFAHKGSSSTVKVRNLSKKYGLPTDTHPVTFLLSTTQGRKGYRAGDIIVLRWFEVLYHAIRLTVEPTTGSP
jgi:hypothetical protein